MSFSRATHVQRADKRLAGDCSSHHMIPSRVGMMERCLLQSVDAKMQRVVVVYPRGLRSLQRGCFSNPRFLKDGDFASDITTSVSTEYRLGFTAHTNQRCINTPHTAKTLIISPSNIGRHFSHQLRASHGSTCQVASNAGSPALTSMGYSEKGDPCRSSRRVNNINGVTLSGRRSLAQVSPTDGSREGIGPEDVAVHNSVA